MKKTIDIERLLDWAIRGELPKGKSVTSDPWDAITRIGQLGTRVDASFQGQVLLGFVPGEPDDDATVVGDELRKLPRDQHIGDDSTAQALLGEFYLLDPVAVRTVMAAKFNLAALVLHFAVMGERPIWDLGTPSPSPVAGDRNQGRGANVKVVGEARGRTVNVFPDRAGNYAMGKAVNLRCPLKWTARLPASAEYDPKEECFADNPTIGQVAEARAEYVAWHAGLCVLATSLSGKLKAFEVLPAPVSLPFPWQCTPAIAPQIIRTGAALNDKLPLMPKREAA